MEFEELVPYVQNIFKILCGNCGQDCELTMACDEEDAARTFEEKGWRIEGGEPICPECMKNL